MGSLMRSEITVEFSLIAPTFDPDYVTDTLNVHPTKAWRKGEPLGVGRRPSHIASWEFKSNLPLSSPLRDHLDYVLSVISPKRDIVRLLCTELTAESYIEAVIYSYNGDRPEIVLDADVVLKIADLGASFGVDLYILDDDGEEDESKEQ
jgi:hypothetical protein